MIFSIVLFIITCIVDKTYNKTKNNKLQKTYKLLKQNKRKEFTMVPPSQFEQRGRIVSDLIHQKFGPDRGAISRAATTIGVNLGNFSRMISGCANTPQKYINALAALPSYTPPLPPSEWPSISADKSLNYYTRLPKADVEHLLDMYVYVHAIAGRVVRRPNFLTHKQAEMVTKSMLLYLAGEHRFKIKDALYMANKLPPEPVKHRTAEELEAALKQSMLPYTDDQEEENPLS